MANSLCLRSFPTTPNIKGRGRKRHPADSIFTSFNHNRQYDIYRNTQARHHRAESRQGSECNATCTIIHLPITDIVQGYPQSRGPSPNRGASVPDFKAVAGNSTESQEAWRKARGIDRSKQVKIVKLSHMRYQHPDMNVITTFLRGMFVTTTIAVNTNIPRLWNAQHQEDRHSKMVSRLRTRSIRLLLTARSEEVSRWDIRSREQRRAGKVRLNLFPSTSLLTCLSESRRFPTSRFSTTSTK